MQNIFQPLKFVLFLCLFNATFIAAQDQRSGISYQALILNTSEVELPGANQKDSPLRNKEICLQFSLIDETGNYEYIEHVRTTTDSQGMVNLVIGTGTSVGGSQWSDIEWSAAMKSLKVDFDITGQCNDFEALSLQQLTAVPFALYAPGAGTAGPQGEAGEPGEDGEDGVAGPSAYEVWLELGNTGDEQTFINSLKGADGDDGDDFAFELPDGVQNGDYLQWIWNGTSWDITVITPDDTSIILISSTGTNNQSVCANVEIEPIFYSFSEVVSGITVIGLPSGLTFELTNNELVISGKITQQLLQTSTFEYQVQVPQSNGPNRVAYGKITFEPAPQILLDLGEQNVSSCLLEPIEPIEYLIENSQSSATITGLPSGITSSIVGNRIIIQGTPGSTLIDGSSYIYTIETDPGTCAAVSIDGTLSFTDCSTCYPTVEAGTDATICSGEIFQIAGNVGNATNIFWTTSGNGTFDNSNSPNPKYVPTNEDFNSGSVTLTVKAQNDSCGSLEELEDSMVLSISDCSSIDVTLINNIEAIVFANDVTFGAEIVTDNIQNIASAGLCYNTTGGPTTLDPKVEQAYYDGGFWKDVPAVFELDLVGVPVDSLFVRPFVTTIGGDTVYGNQIAIANEDPNRNHIYNFSTESGDFSPENYTITTTSEITFQNIISLTNLNWEYESPNYSNIVIVNFPSLDRVTQNFILKYEYSLREFNAPKLREISQRLIVNNNNIEKFLLPELQTSGPRESSISNNENLNELDLSSWEGSNARYYYFSIGNNDSLIEINLDSFYKYRGGDGGSTPFRIIENLNLKSIRFGTDLDLEAHIIIRDNENLEEINFINLTKVQSGKIEVYDNQSLKKINFDSLKSSNDVKDKDYWHEPYILISNNKLLEEINAPSLEDFYKITINNNDSLSEVIFPELTTVHKNLDVQNNGSLSKIHMPKLETTGDKVYNQNSFYLNSNQTLNDINFESLLKVYTSLTVQNNQQLDLNDFPCKLFVLENDGLDCTFGDINVSNNLDDTYCFQDPSLIPPIDIQTVAAFNISSDQAQTATNITSYTKMKSRGIVWSTSANPTIDDVNDFLSENGSLNGPYDSYMYNLQPNTTYYFRAYGEDCNGVFYGNELEFITLP
ncbi:collagen-like protein [Flavobacteriaceae bacterium]|nr:collagen-like protein [Flavobacteriaceae bacterium]